MDGKKLDLDAPLLSFRRITLPAAGEEVGPSLPPRRKTLTSCNSYLKFGQVGVPGSVPFVWEKTPGQPRDGSLPNTTVEAYTGAPKLPPGRSFKENGADLLKGASLPPEFKAVAGTLTSTSSSSRGSDEKAKARSEEEENSAAFNDEDDSFSDARDAFSWIESFSMNCSMSAGAKDPLRSFTKDPQVKDLMMDRFLPAAQAMAADSPHRSWRKPPRASVVEDEHSISPTLRRRRLPLDFQYHLIRSQIHGTDQKEDEQEEEEEYFDDRGNYVGSSFFSSRACGLIQRFCLKSSIGPLNSIQGRPHSRAYSRADPQINAFHHSLGQTKDEDSWEAVYRYKLSHGYHPHRGDGSKMMTESNQLSSWSDSQMLDGSSFLNSTRSALSPDKHGDSKRESGSWKTASSDSCEKEDGSYLEATAIPLNQSPLSLPNILSDTKTIIESAGHGSEIEKFQQTEGSIVTEASEPCTLQLTSSMIAEPCYSSCRVRLNGDEIHDSDFDNYKNVDDGLILKVAPLEKNDASPASPMRPPPLPASPSESWLRRTLPSVSSKGLHQQSFLGIRPHSKKQVSWELAGGDKSVTFEKPPKLLPRRTRFMEVAKGI